MSASEAFLTSWTRSGPLDTTPISSGAPVMCASYDVMLFRMNVVQAPSVSGAPSPHIARRGDGVMRVVHGDETNRLQRQPR